MNNTIRITTALFGVWAVVSVAACGADATTDATPSTTTTTVAASSSTPPAQSAAPTQPETETGDAIDAGGEDGADGASEATPAAPAPATRRPCGPGNPTPAELDAAIAKVPTDGRGYHWVTGAANFSTCNDISYMELDTAQGTVSSPQQLMIFDRNLRFIGTGIRCNAGYQRVVSAAADRITVRYGYIVGDEPLAAPQGSAQVTFRWNGSRVVMDGSLPYGVTYGRC